MKKLKRYLSMLMSLCIIIGVIPSAAAAYSGLPFADVREADWCYDAVRYVYENGLMNGTENDVFSPNTPMTRGMIVTVLHRMEESPSATGAEFVDVLENQYYSTAVAWASANGIINGYGNGLFGPNDTITREQMAAILYRYAQYLNKETAQAGDLSEFIDAAQVGSFAAEAVAWAVGAGLISGIGNNTLAPKGNATRAQVATILMRFMEAEEDVTPEQPQPPIPHHKPRPSPKPDPQPDPEIPEGFVLVQFETNGGSEIENQILKKGELAHEPEDPVYEGYRFLAWYADEVLTELFDFEKPVETDTTVYAKWEKCIEHDESFLDQDPPELEIYSFDTDTRSIPVGEEVTVSFTAEIFAEIDLSGIPVEVKCEKGIVGIMSDDGENGDAVARDGIFTLRTTLQENEEVYYSYYVQVKEEKSPEIGIGFYLPLTDEEAEAIQSVDEDIWQMMQSDIFQKADSEEQMDMVVKQLEQLQSDGLIQEHSIRADDSCLCIEFQYANGIEGLVDLRPRESDGQLLNGYSSEAVETMAQFGTELFAEEGEKRALVLNCFEDTPYRQNYYNDLKAEWDAIGLKTTMDTNVTVRDLKSLKYNPYDMIVFAMHGGCVQDVPDLCINEVRTAKTDKDYSYELKRGTVVAVTYEDNTNGYVIRPDFWRDSLSPKSMENKIIFSETCCFYGCDHYSTNTDTRMARALLDQSAAAVIGYHNSVGADYSRKMMKDVLESIYYGAAVRDALNRGIKKHGENDNLQDENDHKWRAYPVVLGNEDFVLNPVCSGKISGVVKTVDGHVPVEGALLRVYDQHGILKTDTNYAVRTDRDGKYTLTLPEGDYILKISAGWYKSVKVAIRVDAQQTTYTETFLMEKTGSLMGKASGVIRNSLTNAGVPGVQIKIRAGMFNKYGLVRGETISGENGEYEIHALKSGAYTMEYYKSGYVTGYRNIYISNVDLVSQDAIISPISSDSDYRIVLTWGESPRDLDAHLKGVRQDGSRFHVYFGDKYAVDGDVEVCNLDVDNVHGYGQETITLRPATDYPYYYYIHRYAGSGSISTSDARIKVYRGSNMIKVFNAPTDLGSQDYWNVFALVDGELIIRNTITSSEDTSYVS